jgi:oxygen-independent coproporphyrinogen-3 oxidase
VSIDWRAGLPARHLYIHVPFCHRRCAYCDFNTYVNMEHRIAAYTDALCAELTRVAGGAHAVAEVPIDPALGLMRANLRPSIFLGGGTPSMLPLPQIERVLCAADRIVPLDLAEVTVECNPGTVLEPLYLRELRGLGVNRISMGVQSLHDPTLRVLGRIHTAAEARASYEEARRVGFDSINLDFIFGLPGQDQAQWEATLREIVAWDVDHFSLYSLVLEARTPLYAQVNNGAVAVPDDDTTAAMYEAAIAVLGDAGYAHYEISNWARNSTADTVVPQHACHHNLAYWLNADYAACGAGAHGHLAGRRFALLNGIDEYILAVHANSAPLLETTALSTRDLAAETMFMGLRLAQGVSFAHFAERCGAMLDTMFGEELRELVALELLERDAISVRLTSRGRMLGNRVFERFV